MGAAELLIELRGAGFNIAAAGGKLLVTPGSKLTEEMLAALRGCKPELLAVLSAPCNTAANNRPYKLSAADAGQCHAQPWDDATCARFVARVSRFLRLGIDATDADDLAERLHLRDAQQDDRRMCLECLHYRPGRCGNHRRAGLDSPEVGRNLATLLQHCEGYSKI